MDILGIIPARGGSKGVVRKNVVPLCGKPLLGYTCEAASGSKILTRTVLSTDDKEIAETGRSFGIEVPFMRPAELAQDETPTVPVLQHTIRELEKDGQKYDAICLLQPTSPLRTSRMIDDACQKFIESDCDTLLSVLELSACHHPDWALLMDDKGLIHWVSGKSEPPPRRQELAPAYHREGSIYIVKTELLMKKNTLDCY